MFSDEFHLELDMLLGVFINLSNFQLFHKVNANLKPLHDGILQNRENWQKLAEEKETSPEQDTGIKHLLNHLHSYLFFY